MPKGTFGYDASPKASRTRAKEKKNRKITLEGPGARRARNEGVRQMNRKSQRNKSKAGR